ncbi:MAG TPA: quinolinate synthase NadA [Anaeromyxobacter sp.]
MSLPAFPIHDPVANPDSGSDLPLPEVAALEEEIRVLAREKNAVILAHNYQLPEIQKIAHHVGDSLGLAIIGKKLPQTTIVFCGVHFMAESAKILAPEKRVLLPNLSAGCSLADSITAESLEDWKARYPDHAVVTYVNSTAEVKALSDICCTSANAASVVRSLPQKKILFTPDKNLGRWVASKVPEKEVVIYDGCCPIHDVLRSASVNRVKGAKPDSVVIAHPECRSDVLEIADEVCSTTGMLSAVERHPQAKTFIVATEHGIVYQMKKRYPEKEFIVADGCIGCRMHCPYMKMVDLVMVRDALRRGKHEIHVPPDVAAGARRALERMIAVPRD